MGRRAAEEEQNHWPGFVDALSTIVMVVTFLLIILAIVIFVLSQSIARSFIESATEHTATSGGGDMLSPDPNTATQEFQSDVAPTETPTDTQAGAPPVASPNEDTQEQSTPETSASKDATQTEQQTENQPQAETAETDSTADQTPSPSAPDAAKTEINEPQENAGDKQSDGDALATKAEQELSDVPEIDAEDLAIRSRRVVDEEEVIVVETPDVSKEEKETRVTQAATFLTLQFDPIGTKISESANDKVAAFLSEKKAQLDGRKIAVWAFVDVENGSVSQARRIAYYRALAVRNTLLENGLLAENVSVEIRPNPSEDDNNTVRLVVQE
ncbi:MAG: hypothetical protein AAF340_04040 [Pseudomonadota bacterium]